MIGIYNPDSFASYPNSSLLNIDFFNVLYLDLFKTYTAKFLKLQIWQLLFHFYLDRFWDWTLPKGINMVILNNIKNWLIGTSSTVAINRWTAVAYRGQVGWQLT